MAIPAEDRLINSDELCAWFRCHKITLYNRIKNDPNFPQPVRGINGRRHMWREATVRAYIAAREEEALA